jgi:DNA-binding MltR family transcriptional regulator
MAYKNAGDVLKQVANDASIKKLLFESDDWPTVIMVGSFLDLFLEQMIIGKLPNPPSSNTQRSELFGPSGPLSSFYSRIVLGYSMGFFSEEIKHDLTQIKWIRNEAAHRINEFSFSSENVSKHCDALKLAKPISKKAFDTYRSVYKSSFYESKWKKLGHTSPRAKFTLAAFHIVLALSRDFMKTAIKAFVESAKRAIAEDNLSEEVHGILKPFIDDMQKKL